VDRDSGTPYLTGVLVDQDIGVPKDEGVLFGSLATDKRSYPRHEFRHRKGHDQVVLGLRFGVTLACSEGSSRSNVKNRYLDCNAAIPDSRYISIEGRIHDTGDDEIKVLLRHRLETQPRARGDFDPEPFISEPGLDWGADRIMTVNEQEAPSVDRTV
jgi:hypothetical protein